MSDPQPEKSEKSVSIDINNLKLEPELLTIDPKADAFAAPAPAPKGEYNFKLKLGTDKWKFGKTQRGGRRYFMAHLELRFIAPGQRFDGWPVFDRASTLVQEGNQTNRIVGIMQAAGIKVPTQIADTDLVTAFDRFANGEPTIRAAGDWRGYCQPCDKTVLNSMERFPEILDAETGKPTGAHSNVAKCRLC